MKNTVLIFVGLVLLGTGILTYYVLGLDSTTIVINGSRNHSVETRTIVQYSIGGFLASLGLFFMIGGMIGRSRYIKQQQQINHIIQTGIAVNGTVTFVDRNFRFLVNKTPIYSIVEYTYQDKTGKQYSRRVETIPSDYVIRHKIEVGCTVSVKYSSEDPSKSTIIIVMSKSA